MTTYKTKRQPNKLDERSSKINSSYKKRQRHMEMLVRFNFKTYIIISA